MKYRFLSGLNLTDKCPQILGHGNQGTVIKKEGYALKVLNLKAGRKNKDDIEVAKRLSKLPLKHFITPYDIRVRNGKIHSYKMALIHRNKGKRVVDMDIQDVIRNISEIREEANILSENGILLRDLQEHNICIGHTGDNDSDSIIIYDFSDYTLSDSPNLKEINNSEIEALFGSFIIYHEMSDVSPLIIYDEIYSGYLQSGYPTIEEYFDKSIKKKTISQHIKSKVKK